MSLKLAAYLNSFASSIESDNKDYVNYLASMEGDLNFAADQRTAFLYFG